MQSAVIVSADNEWRILGGDSLALMLKPGERVVCEPGAMIAHQDGIEATVTAGDGMWSLVSRSMFSGETILRDSYTNASNSAKELTLTVPFPGGKIIPVQLKQYTAMIIAPGAWLATKGSDIHFDVTVVKSLYAGLFAGQGFVLPTITGSAVAFLCGGGTVLTMLLGSKESIVIDEKSFLACESTVDIKACTSGSIWMMMCGGEGAFQCKLTGPGRVVLQSMPVGVMTKGIESAAKMAKGIRSKG